MLHLHIPTHFILYHKLSVFAIANVIFSQNLPFHISFNSSAFTLRPHRPQPPCFCPTATSTTTALLLPYGNIDHSRLAFTLRPHRPQPLRFTLRQHRPQPLRLRPTATSTITALPSPNGNIDHNRPAFTLRPHRPQPVISHNKAV